MQELVRYWGADYNWRNAYGYLSLVIDRRTFRSADELCCRIPETSPDP
jgi:hypothetical protein